MVTAHPMYLVFPLGLASSFCLALHSLSWSPDPCSAYTVETGRRQKLTPRAPSSSSASERGKNPSTTTSGPVVLAKKEGAKGRRSPVLTVIAVSALAYALWRIRSASA